MKKTLLAASLALAAVPAGAGDLQESLSGAAFQSREAAKQSGDGKLEAGSTAADLAFELLTNPAKREATDSIVKAVESDRGMERSLLSKLANGQPQRRRDVPLMMSQVIEDKVVELEKGLSKRQANREHTMKVVVLVAIGGALVGLAANTVPVMAVGASLAVIGLVILMAEDHADRRAWAAIKSMLELREKLKTQR